MRALFVSGGSGGHLTPLVAVERALKEIDPKAKSHFLCSAKPADAVYLKHEKAAFTTAPIPRKSVMLPITWMRNARIARRVLREFKPDVIFSKGGAVSVPLCKIAHRKGIPIVIHESDSVMGKANKMIAPLATAICVGFPPSDEQRNLGSEPIVTGNPIRKVMTKGSRKRGLDLAHLTGKHPVLLVLGGSQGAESLNEAIKLHVKELLPFCDIVHLTGPGKSGAKRQAGYWSKEFVYDELADLYAIADLALCRAGAGTISECAANSIPMILVPIRGLANDHQYENAVRAESKGAAIILEQIHLEHDLPSVIRSLLQNNMEKLKPMTAATAELRQPEAARRIAKILIQCIASKKIRH